MQFGALATLAALKKVEDEFFDHYFDTLIRDRATDAQWQEHYARDAARADNLGHAVPARYANRAEYRKKVSVDFASARRLIREFLTAGILSAGTNCYAEHAVTALARQLWMPLPPAISPEYVSLLAEMLPLLHDTTRDIGTASSVITVRDAHDETSTIPGVMLTSSFNITLTQISRLLVRRTFNAVTSDGTTSDPAAVFTLLHEGSLFLRVERQYWSELERDARVLAHLLGIWVIGEPFPTPSVDAAALDAARRDTTPGERLINMTTLQHKSGWCLFEALHEYSHILMGDWLLRPEEWTTTAEMRADAFALHCLMAGGNDLSRVLYLRGACSFLRLLGIAEKRYGRTPRHPAAWHRADLLERFGLENPYYYAYDARFFALTGQMDLLAHWCYEPDLFGIFTPPMNGR